MVKCDQCGADVVPVSKQWIDRDTWEITDKDQVFYVDPSPHPDGRFYVVDNTAVPAHVIYVPFNEEANLSHPSERYITHASTCGVNNG